jgi:signal transduction histidine kinase
VRVRRVPAALTVLTILCCVAQPVLLASGGMSLWGAEALDHGFPLLTLSAATGALVGGLILSRHPRHRIGWLFTVGLLGTAAGQAAEAYGWAVLDGDLDGSSTLAHLASWFANATSTFLFASLAFLALLAPGGQLPSRRWRPVAYLLGASMALFFVGLALVPPQEMEPSGAPNASLAATVLAGSGQVGMTVGLLLAGVALVVRLRRAAGEERQQLRWIAAAVALVAATLMAIVVHNLARGGNVPADLRLAVLLSVAVMAVPVAAGFAVLRYRLYDIDLVIGTAVKAGVLAGFVTIGYVAVVTLAGIVLGRAGPSDFVGSLTAMVVVALTFQPLRRRLGRMADRVVYGRRADPYEALARFSRSLAAHAPSVAVLPRFAEALAGATGASEVQARLSLPGGAAIATWPDAPSVADGEADVRLPVQHAGEQLGELAVRLPAGGSLSREQSRLAAELSKQAGLAFHNASLEASLQAQVEALARDTTELAGSRRRLVLAEDIERDHLVGAIRRDVGRYLAPLTAELDRLAGLVTRDSEAADRLLEELEAQANRALDAMRDLSHGLFPALLADRGLAAALESYRQHSDQRVSLEISPDVRGVRLAPEREAAGYFCCVETLAALDAGHLGLLIRQDRLEIQSEGRLAGPLPADFRQWLVDRAEAVGGSVQFDSRPGGELALCVSFPLGSDPPRPGRQGVGRRRHSIVA